MKRNIIILIVLAGLMLPASFCAEANSEEREREIRDRYERVLLRNPFQERAFNQVYDSYLKYEGVEAWVDKLKPQVDSPDASGVLLLLGQVYDRQFKSKEAIDALEKAGQKGENRPEFQVLLGTLYYKVGDDDKAAALLGQALEKLTDLDQRSTVSRMLGNLYLRQGKRDEAIGAWKKIAEQNTTEIFSQLELAEIYEDNRMWEEAIAVYRKVVEMSKDDPYRKCRSLRSIGNCLIQAEKFKEAIATFEEALGLVAPGNWLFEDLKTRLVGVYEDIGDLDGLTQYVRARLDQNPADNEFRDLLAETYTRMGKFPEAEQEYKSILERTPRSSNVYEKLIGLYARMEKKDQVAASYEKLLELFPTDTDYIRRLGEFYLRESQPDKAKETWQRITKDQETGERLAQLAGWYEEYEFADEAIATYEKALEKKRDKEWAFRLASLKYQKGDEARAVELWLSAIDPLISKIEDYAEVAGILESFNKNKEAATLRQKAVELDPENLEARHSYAKVLMNLERFDSALEQFSFLADQSENEYFAAQGDAGRLDAFRALGVLEEKQKEWEKELDANPRSALVLGKLARLYERAGQREKAIELYERRKETEPDNVEFSRSLAALYKSSKRTDQAIELFNALAEKDKNRARVYHKELLEIYLGLDLKDEAIAAAEKMVSLAPADPEARLDLAQVYALYRETEKSLREYRHVLRLESNEPDYYRQYGEALVIEKRWGEAQEAFRKMLDVAREDSTRLTAVQNLTRIYLQQEDFDSLAMEFSRRVRNTPKKLAAHEELAAIYKEAGQFARCVELLENALEQVDEKENALRALVRVAYEAQDFGKVRNYYEQLLAMSGKPSPNEYERLGMIYAQMGEIEKARETWNKIYESNPKDPKLAEKLAGVLRNEGFTEEALQMKAKAVELDPFNYKTRFDYAQMLASAEQQVQALEQLRKLLELGDKQQETEEKEEKEKKVQRITRGQQNQVISPYQFMYGIRNYSRYYGGGWNGKYKEFRPQVIMFMASLAQQSIGEDEFIKEFEERVAKNKDNTDLKRDLLIVYQNFNRIDDALKLANEVLAVAPDDVELLQRTALYYASQQQHDKAIPLLEKLAATQPKHRLQALQGLIPLYFQNKQEDKAIEMVDALIKDNPSDLTTIFSAANLMQNHGKWEKAREIWKLAEAADPRYRRNMLFSIAASYNQEGKKKEAHEIYKEVLLGDDVNYSGYIPNRRQANLYVPTIGVQPRSFSGSGVLGRFPQNVGGYIDYQKSEAFSVLIQASEEDGGPEKFLQEIESIARSYQKASTLPDKNKAWEAAKILIAYYTLEKEYDKAADLLKVLRDGGMEEIEWFNLAIYLEEVRENSEGMIKYYDEAAKQFPGKSRDVAIAKTSALIQAKKFDEAAAIVREINQQRVPPRIIVGMIRPFIQAGEKKLATQLLEEHLQGASRNSEALAMLANLYGEENDYNKAIALAHEAWDRKAHGRSNPGYMYSYSYYNYGSPSVNVDNLLRELHRYYVAAGKSQDLIKQFAERLEKQPSSVQAHENLAELYRMNQEEDKAIEIYTSLAEKRPHLMQTKKAIAQIYSQKGEIKKATEMYEKLLKDYPTAYYQLSWELRYLYQRMGKGKDLAQMEEKMAEKAKDPNSIRQMAQKFQNVGDLDKAAEMYEKLIKMTPTETYSKNALASIYVEQGRVEDALKLYRDYLDSPMTRANGYVDSYSLQQIAGFFRAAGKVDELKERADKDLEKNSDDQNAKTLLAQIAILEKRFGDALDHYEKTLSTGRDYNALYNMMELADITGDISRILEIVDKKSGNQNYWDLNRLAKFFLVQGNTKKAEDYMKKWMMDRIQSSGGGGWEYEEIMRSLTEMQMWDLAEDFAKKNRTSVDDGYYKEQFDRTLVQHYISNDRFKPIFDEVLAKESVKGRDLDLVRKLLEHYREANDPVRQRELLEKIMANDPSNKDLKFELAQVYSGLKQHSKRLPILEALVKEDPNNNAYRNSLAETLITVGRPREALDLLQKWAEEKPLQDRYKTLAEFQEKAGLQKAARQSLLKAQELADSSKKHDIALEIALFDARMGDVEIKKQALLDHFYSRKNANSFSRAFDALRFSGYLTDAYQFFVKEREGFLDQYRNRDFMEVCFNNGDLKTSLDVNWQYLRYGERYERDYYFRPVTEFFSNHGKSHILLDDFQARVLGEEKPNVHMINKMANLAAELGYPEKALVAYDQILVSNPYNQEVVNWKANLLLKLGRKQEGIEVLKSRKLGRNLQEELSNHMQLVQLLHKAGLTNEAEKEIQGILSWAKGAGPLLQAANFYYEQKLYDKALLLYEQSRKVGQGWNFNELLRKMTVCLAKTGKPREAAELARELTDLYPHELPVILQNLNAEKLYDTTAELIEKEISRNPTKVQNYLGLAHVLAMSGGTAKALETFSRAEKAVASEMQDELRKGLGSFLVERKLIDEAVKNAGTDNKLLRDGLVVALGQLKKNDPSRSSTLKFLQGHEPEDHNLKFLLAEAYRAGGDTDGASKLYRALLESDAEIDVKISAARELAAGPADPKVGAFFNQLMQTHPQKLVQNLHTFMAAAKTGGDDVVQNLRSFVSEAMLFEPQIKFYDVLITLSSGDTNKAATEALSLIPGEKLTIAQIEKLEDILKQGGKSSERRQVLERVAAGGYGATPMWRALKEIAIFQLDQNNFPAAIATYQRLFPVWSHSVAEEALLAMVDRLNAENLPQFREAIVRAIKSNPQHDGNSTLLGIYHHASQNLGKGESISALAAEVGLDGLEKSEAEAWETLIEQWELSGPFFAELQQQEFPPELELKGEIEEKPEWKTVDPNKALGIVRVPRALDLQKDELAGRIIYARTEIESTDDRLAILSVGSDDWLKIWVNGEEVHSTPRNRSLALDQDRVLIQLKKGTNKVLFKVGNQSDAWAFCARLLEAPQLTKAVAAK